MSTLQEFRQQYPQYNDMPDIEVANNLHKSYYSDIPKKEFYTRLGLKPNKRTGLKEVGADILEGVANVPGMVKDIAYALPGEIYGTAKQVFTDPKRALKNVGAGFGELGRKILNAPANVLDYTRERELTPEWLRAGRPEFLNDVDYGRSLGIEGQQSGDALLRGLPEIPFWMTPGGVGKGLLAKSLGKAAQITGLGALHNQNPVTLGLTGKLIESGSGLLGKGISKTTEGAVRLPSYLHNLYKGELPPIVNALEATGERIGVPTLAGDLGKKGTQVQALTEFAEKTPVINVKKNRLNQQDKALKAAENTTELFKKEMINENFNGPEGLSEIKKIAQGGSKRAKAAQSLLEDIQSSGEDWNYILKTSGNVKLLNNKIKADKLYDKVTELSEPYGPVKLNSTMKSINNSLKELKETPTINKSEIKAIEGIKKDLMRDLSFDTVRNNVRKIINNKITDYSKGENSLVGKTGVQYFQEIKNSIDRDLDVFATSHGTDLKNAWKAADNYYKYNVVPYKDRSLVKALKKESNPDEIFRMFIKNGGSEGDYGTGRAQKLYGALDDKGKSAVRYGMMKKAAEHAIDETKSFSPAKYATALEKLEASRGIFFKGTSRAEIDGLIKFMRHIERAGQMKSPDTGIKTLPTLMLGLAAQTGNVATLGLSAVGLKWLVTSPTGKRLLLTASNIKPGTQAFINLVDKINNFLATKIKAPGMAINKETK